MTRHKTSSDTIRDLLAQGPLFANQIVAKTGFAHDLVLTIAHRIKANALGNRRAAFGASELID